MKRLRYIMKRNMFIVMLLVATLLLLTGVALAETDPIVCSMEIKPARLIGPGPVDVVIRISNSGDTDMKDPLLLYNPVSQPVLDFGTNGAVLLQAGESRTWEGKWDVNQRTLENGALVFFVKYTLYKDNGEGYSQSQPIRGEISLQEGSASIDVKRTISPTAARSGQEVIVQYDISNTGTLKLQNVTIQEHADINKDEQKVPELEPGKMAQVKFPVKMGNKDLTSSAVVTYQSEGSTQTEKIEVEAAKIVFGEPAMTATLTSSVKGVPINGKFTLTLALKNNGTVDYTNLRVMDPTLGEVFSNQSLAKSGTLSLEKEIALTATTEYQFTVYAIDNTGTEVSLTSDAVTVEAVDPDKMVHLSLALFSDKTEVFEQPGRVRFTIYIENDSPVEAKDVTVSHGATKIYTFASIPAGEARRLTRDAALSMEGKYQFSASLVDALGNAQTFPSNEIQIAFTVPTAAPATPTPMPNPTAEPTFHPETMPPITDSSIALVPKVLQQVLLPILILGGLGLLTACVLLLIATRKRAAQKKASEAAYDHLERAPRRDYAAPAEIGDSDEDEAESKVDYVELPHMKYVRSALERSPQEEKEKKTEQAEKGAGLYDDDFYREDNDFAPEAKASDDTYTDDTDVSDDTYADDAYEDEYKDSTEYSDYSGAVAGADQDEYVEGYGEEGYEPYEEEYEPTAGDGSHSANDMPVAGEAYHGSDEEFIETLSARLNRSKRSKIEKFLEE